MQYFIMFPLSDTGMGLGGVCVILAFILIGLCCIGAQLWWEMTYIPTCPLCEHYINTPSSISKPAQQYEEIYLKGEFTKDGYETWWFCPYCNKKIATNLNEIKG